MSGGPVFNAGGEVVGIVSRSLLPDPAGSHRTGKGWATYLELLPGFEQWLPTLDPLQPGYRTGWAVINESHWNRARFFRTLALALEQVSVLGPGHRAAFGTNRIGTDEFQELPPGGRAIVVGAQPRDKQY